MGQAWRGLTHGWVVGVWCAVVGQARSGLSQMLGGVQQWVGPGGDSHIAGGGDQQVVGPGVSCWVRNVVIICNFSSLERFGKLLGDMVRQCIPGI